MAGLSPGQRMETFLNALWVALAIAAPAVWWTRWGRFLRVAGLRGQLCSSGISLACALFLLFPVISLTDDLQAVPAVAEESRSTRRGLQIWKSSQAGAEPENHPGLCARSGPVSFSRPNHSMVARLSPFEAPSIEDTPSRESQGRAPPAQLS